MEKFYLVNGKETETAYFNSNEEAFIEAQNRNKRDILANWQAYDRRGDRVFFVYVHR